MIEQKSCRRCVMDTSDPNIVFDERGYCNHCVGAERLLKARWFPNKVGQERLNEILTKIISSGKSKEYDCVMGVSGGVDSSYLLYQATEVWGLRVLAVHVNAGWNSEVAESNIEKLVNKLNVDLYTYVVNWEEVRDLQLSYFKSGLINLDVPQDHVFFAQLYKKAAKEKMKYILTGHNLATESITPASWGYSPMDLRQIKYIQKTYGSLKLKSFTTISLFERLMFSIYPGQKIIKPLDYMPYNKEEAKDFLQAKFNWKDYGVKHGESVFTRFYQNYWLPERYGFDKRKAHLSSQIISGLISREQALEQLKEPLYDAHTLTLDKEYICNKMEIDEKELDLFIKSPKVNFTKYPSSYTITKSVNTVRNFIKYRS